MPHPPHDAISRRRFLKAIASASAGTAVAPLGLLHARTADAREGQCAAPTRSAGFGPLSPALARNAADLRDTIVGDLSRTPLLDLPPGFAYTALSITGASMSDGSIVPGDHDGMACFPGRGGSNLLVRNHELSPGENEYGNRQGVQAPNGRRYDPYALPAGRAAGGTTTLSIDRFGRLLRDHVSLAGTSRNCAGGPTPWRSWISCEEDTAIPFFDRSVTKRHGYCFEVPADAEEAVDPVPIVAAGRFNHEAVAIDRATSILYETEDRSDSCFYRYVSNRRANRFGHLQEGGSLYALAIDPNTRAHCDGTALQSLDQGGGVFAVDTRSGVRPFLGQPLPVRWLRIDDVDPFGDSLRFEARSKGASLFERGEGAWAGRRHIYFSCTSGGDEDSGQVWAYDPRHDALTLVFESPGPAWLDRPDNLTVARDGTLYLCEDGGAGNFVVGIDRRGQLFPFLRNALDPSEFAGVCLSPDNRFLFVNSQQLGITFAVFRSDQRALTGSPLLRG
jgi:secreted PhoX family phosphatase